MLQQVLVATAETAKPWYPIDEEDSLQFANGRLAVLLFYGGSAYGPRGIIWNNLTGVDRNLLYPAIRAVAGSPLGFTRNNLLWTYPMLTHAETLAVSGAVVDSVREFAPSDRMFAFAVRQTGFNLMEKFNIAEGVPAGMKYMVETRAGDRTAALRTLERCAASYTTITPVPDVIAAVTPFLNASGGKLLFIFRRNIDAQNDPATTIFVEYGSDLASWTPAVHQREGPEKITITVVPDGFASGIDQVTVAIPPSHMGGGKLFVRLNVEVAE